MSRHWTIRPKPLALVSPGRSPLVIPVKEIGRGMFSVALRGSEGFMTETVFLITFRGVKEKDILVSLSDYSPHLPQIEKVGRLKAGKGTWNLYQSPFYTQRLSTSNRKIVRTMERCFDKLDKDKRFFLKPGKVMYPDMAHPLMKAIRDCAESGRVPYPILAALDMIIKKTRRGGYFFDIVPRNFAQDRRGNLILLDVFATLDGGPPLRTDKAVFVEGL